MAGRLNVPYLPRNGRSVEDMIRAEGLHGLVAVGKKRISCVYPGGEFFFHPGMAKLRIKEILSGKNDQMIKALDLSPGDSLLDCTLGLGSDAIVASFVSKSGEITGLESSPVIWLIVREGLSTYGDGTDDDLVRAMRRIRVICADYNQYLKLLPDRSVDVIYFDPMFRVPGKKSCAMEAMRPLADPSPLSPEALGEAIRVARRRVVVKEAKDSREFSRLGIDHISGGKYSPVAYGIIEKRGG
ncbi:MAG: class I SAM-dependent methyltransferase [Peptococcaceae bacterium]|nr:class I SAM-dependent methyltransferase [Peptococcaceae bacterium]